MRRVRTEVQSTQKAVTSAQAGFQNLATSLTGLAAGVLSVQALSTAMRDVVKVGIDMQNLRQSFAAISGGAQAGNRDFQFVVQTANRLGLELQSVAGQYRSLSAATRGTTLEGKDTRDLFTALTRAAQTYGLSTDQLGRALTAMQQIASKGKVSMEELRGQLGEALPGAVQIAARAFGVTTKGLEDLVAKGLDATTFWRQFTTQLMTEVPAAAAKAGTGIQHLGNEIVFLKDAIARSGLVSFLDTVSSKLAGVLEQTRAGREQAKETVLARLGPAAGAATPAEMERMIVFAKHQNAIADASLQAMVDQITTRAQAAQAAANRVNEVSEPFRRQQETMKATTAANKDLTTAHEAHSKALDTLNKSAQAAPELFGKMTGSLKEQITFLEKRKAILEKSLESVTTLQLARSAKAEPIPPELAAQQESLRRQLRETVAGIEQRQQAIKDAAAAERKAIQDTEAAKRKAQQLADETRRQDLQQAEEVARVHATNIAALRTLSERYTEVKATRDADTASMLQAALATSQYAKEAERLAAAIADVQRIEAQLPALRSAAKSSAAEFEAIQDILKDFEPDIDLTRREQLAKRLEDLKNVTGDQETIAKATRQMEETLAIEKQQEQLKELEELGSRVFDHLGDAIEEFTRTGTFNFKAMIDAMLSDFMRFSMQSLSKMAVESSWWQTAMQAVIGGAGTAGGQYGMSATQTAAVQTDINAGMASNPELFAFGGGMAAGGPVMPNRYYTVGERGPETFIPGQSGTIVPNGGMGGVTVNQYISTPDVGGFRANERQLWAAAMRQGQQARRIL